ncbi:MAG TPA: Holliday junction branch migration protein RuvA [Thermoflexales bacterium]|nr:Holliday junction branch migration protein RuvA [Thermoflexales bacterium]HQW36144.1 Holliday junction branch migration protein RuvA [Thermoflexales bacterium]HQX75091.1 Holliday junction branch migration protein RuvA [Thermoflexales bacterium]HQZ21963.1 Holliday junction branch migration protein RuvA [Thermoflexales bacterium]HQZ99220.1 Holliday junction branch migration protein RuvA [Thermoflexales bacterium]
MIARLRGTILSVKPPSVVIDVNGVGYRVMCSQAALDKCEPGRNADLHTHMMVREDDVSLYGFASEDEVALFLQLLSVQGVGARTAIAMLSKLSPETLRAAIANGQIDTLSRVPGIGKKTAEKIVFALRGKLGGMDAAPGGFTAAPLSSVDAEVISALTSLGYSIAEAQAALGAIPREEKLDLEEKIRRSLAYFG